VPAALIFLSTTPVTCSLTMVGNVDIWTLIGCSIMVLGEFKFALILGSLFCVGGNADQSIAISLVLAIYSLSGSRTSLKIMKIYTPFAVGSYLMLRFFVGKSPIQSIHELLFANLTPIIRNSLGMWHLELYSLMSACWIPWIYFVWLRIESNRKRFFVGVSVVVIPFLLIFAVLDGTRVGTTVGFLTLSLSFVDFGKFDKLGLAHFKRYRIYIPLVFFFLPTVLVGNGPLLRLPYLKLILH